MQLAEKGDISDFVNKTCQYYYRHVGKNYVMPINVCKAIFYELLERVQSLHSEGILHRDIKLSNVVLDHNYHIRLVDFGFAVGRNTEITNKSAGTPGYRAL